VVIYRGALRRRIRRLVRSRLFNNVRTATRNLDLPLAIATPPTGSSALCRDRNDSGSVRRQQGGPLSPLGQSGRLRTRRKHRSFRRGRGGVASMARNGPSCIYRDHRCCQRSTSASLALKPSLGCAEAVSLTRTAATSLRLKKSVGSPCASYEVSSSKAHRCRNGAATDHLPRARGVLFCLWAQRTCNRDPQEVMGAY
jgi:hypothetical protein